MIMNYIQSLVERSTLTAYADYARSGFPELVTKLLSDQM